MTVVEVALTCRRCGDEFERRNPRGRLPFYCPTCHPIVRGAGRDPALARARRRRWIEAHPEAHAASQAKWREANAEKVREYRRAGKKRHPEANRRHVKTRKARALGVATVTFTAEQLAARLAFYGFRCWICRGEADTIDHVKPLAKGGAHMLANIRPACVSCNSRKGSRWPL